MKYLIWILLFSVSACGHRNNRTDNNLVEVRNNHLEWKKELNDLFKKDRNDFDSSFLDHFPPLIESDCAFTFKYKDFKDNKVGYYLYEFNVNPARITKLLTTLGHVQGYYSSNDTCLLIVNMISRKLFLNNSEWSFRLDEYFKRDCVSVHLPIPKFDDFNLSEDFNIGLPPDYDLFVISSGHGLVNAKYDLVPDVRMPQKWANGYSKGIAINNKFHNIVFWSIMW